VVVLETVTVVAEDGRITLPAEVGQTLGVQKGDEVVILFEENGREVTLRPRSLREEVTAGVARVGRPLDPQEMNRIFEEAVVEEYLEEMRRSSESST
jgi:AbrB family looped-hinge helix DNA binding protein